VTTGRSSNAELIRRGYGAFNRGDLDAALELCAPDVVFMPLPDSPMGVTFHGHEGFREMIAENAEMFDSYRNEPEEIIEVAEDKIVVLVRSEARGRMSGIEVGGRLAHLWTLRDGKAIRCESFGSRDAALSAASADA
jgi:ketosteroid isomerase-like protein